MKKWYEEVIVYRDEVEEVGVRVQEMLDESYVNSRMGCQVIQLIFRYQVLFF